MEKEVKKDEVKNVNTNDANQKWGFSHKRCVGE